MGQITTTSTSKAEQSVAVIVDRRAYDTYGIASDCCLK